MDYKNNQTAMERAFENKIDDCIEDSLDVMESPTNLSAEMIEQRLQNPSCRQACKDVQDSSLALLLDMCDQQINVDSELAKFKLKYEKANSRKWSVILKSAAGVAALFLVLLVSHWMLRNQKQDVVAKGYTVFIAHHIPQQVTIQSNSKKIVVDDKSASATQLIRQMRNVDDLAAKGEKNRVASCKLTVPCGRDFKITLSDGSVVWLNANSSFVYPTAFEGKERIVFLEGEAYFKVAKDKQHPFIVKTKYMETQVYGTEFNVKCYDPEDAHVVLISGSVGVTNLKNKSYKVITPGDDAHVMPSGELITQKIDVDSYLYWKDGYFYFDKEPLKNVMQNIGRWYNMTVEFKRQKDMDIVVHFTGDRSMPLPHIITLLNRMKKVNVVLENDKIVVH